MALAETTRAGVEDELREAMLTGRLVDWRTSDATADEPARGASWDAQRTVHATLLAELLTETKGPGSPRALRLAGARIVGQLDLEATELVCPLLLRGCWLAEPLLLAEARAPALRLPGCHLPALSAEQLATRGNLVLNDGFTAGGGIRLLGAHIGGYLRLDGASLTNSDGRALQAERLSVDQSMFCRWGFAATGEVNLLGAHIGGSLEFDGATLTNPNGRALNADTLTVDQSMFCREGFAATGEVNLLNAHIGGSLEFDGATLTNPNGRALHLQGLRASILFLRRLSQPPQVVDFTQARVGALVDQPSSWPHQAILDGFVYEALYELGQVSARQRLGWLARDPGGYSPQPYEQLAAVYRRAGRDQDARAVAIAKQRARRRTLGLAERLWSLLLDALVGYGYRTWLAGAWLLGFWLVGWVVFDRAHAHQDLILAKPGEAHPGFQGAVYALDTLLPVVDLRQQAVWIPRGGAQWWASVSILAGWVLTTAVVAALTGLLKRD
jgi:type IV secretory pathway TrbD component